MGADPGNNSIPNSNSQFVGNPGKSSENASENSRTIGTLLKVTFGVDVSTTLPNRPHIPCVLISLPLKLRSHMWAKSYDHPRTPILEILVFEI